MKRSTLVVALFAGLSAVAQTQIPNSNFENVFTATGMNPSSISIHYDSLNGGWTSGNPIKRYIPIDNGTQEYYFMQDTNYTWSGSSSHALVLRSFMIGPVLATGNLGTGTFVYNSSNPFASVIFGVPFADRPISMIGYYQYNSMGSDTCLIRVVLTKWNTGTMQRDTIGIGNLYDNTTFASYKQFSIPITYGSAAMPDTCSIVCMSSAYGLPASSSDSPRGTPGSTLIVDDFQMIYNTSGIAENTTLKGKIYANEGAIQISLDKAPTDGKVQVIDMSGKLLYLATLEKQSSTISLNTTGVVVVRVFESNGTYLQEKIMLQH